MTYHREELEAKVVGRKTRAVQLILILAALVIAASGFVYRDSLATQMRQAFSSSGEEPIPTMPLSKEAFQLEVPANGEVTGLDSVPVITPNTRAGGLKIAWLIPEGSFVSAGDPVARFDNTDARLNLEKQQNMLDQNQERVKITGGKQSIDEKVLGLDRSDAENEYNYAMTVLPQDETLYAKWDIIEAKINANYSKERIDFLTNKGRVQKRIARADQQILAIEKNKAQGEMSIAKQTLDSLELKAPKGGLVIYDRRNRMREAQIGDESWPGQPLVEIVDLAALQARLYVLEMDAGNLAKDKAVDIRLDSLPEKAFHGIIRSVAALAQPLERNSPLKYFACEVTIKDAYEDLKRIKPGMSLKANIILEKYDSCFVVPASAVTTKGAENLVYVKQGNSFLARQVKLGTSTHGQSTVLGGVQDNEIIAMRNPFETRKAHLPDFSKAAPGGPMGGRMMIFR